ncbi:MAG TPA: AI-2E family transporter [Rubrobacter sp.]|nr:AI-2E family transporter [Rubrobacter sp.]
MERPATSGRTVYAGIGFIFALLLGAYFVYKITGVVLAFLLTILFSIILSAPVNYLHRRGLPRTWGVLAVIAALAAGLWLFGLAVVPIVETQSRQLAAAFPTLLEGAVDLFNRVQGFFGFGARVSLSGERLPDIGRQILTGSAVSTAAGVGLTLATALSLGLVVLIATVYLVIRPEPWVHGFVSLFPAGWRQRTREVLWEMYHTVQRWFIGQLAAMTFIAVFWAISLSVIGVPFALLLGIFSGLVSFIPYVGATISVVLPLLLALVSEPFTAVYVVLAFIVIQQIEGNILQPILMSRAVDLHPALVVFAILTMGTLFGIVGVFVAVPLVAVLQVLVRELWVSRMDRIGTDPDPPVHTPKSRKLPDFVVRALRYLR